MRIDFVLGSPALSSRVDGASIDREDRKGKGASDHAPVIVDPKRLLAVKMRNVEYIKGELEKALASLAGKTNAAQENLTQLITEYSEITALWRRYSVDGLGLPEPVTVIAVAGG